MAMLLGAAERLFASLDYHVQRPVRPPRSVTDSQQRARFHAEARFFDPFRSKRSRRGGLQRALEELAAFRGEGDNAPPVSLDGRPARWIITVDRMYAEKEIATLFKPDDNNSIYSVAIRVPRSRVESFTLGSTLSSTPSSSAPSSSAPSSSTPSSSTPSSSTPSSSTPSSSAPSSSTASSSTPSSSTQSSSTPSSSAPSISTPSSASSSTQSSNPTPTPTPISCDMSGDRWWLRLRYGLVRFDGGWPDNYDTILYKLKRFVGEGESRDFAKLLIDLAHGKNLTKDTLATEYRLTTINEGERERALDLFRRVFFLCLVREQAAWQSAGYIDLDGSDPYKAGLCVSFARALLLMRDGHLKLDDVFGNYAMYNPYTVKNMFWDWDDEVLPRCKRIDDKFVEHNEGVELTAEQAHKDLRAIYGGESDTEGEDYAVSDDDGDGDL